MQPWRGCTVKQGEGQETGVQTDRLGRNTPATVRERRGVTGTYISTQEPGDILPGSSDCITPALRHINGPWHLINTEIRTRAGPRPRMSKQTYHRPRWAPMATRHTPWLSSTILDSAPWLLPLVTTHGLPQVRGLTDLTSPRSHTQTVYMPSLNLTTALLWIVLLLVVQMAPPVKGRTEKVCDSTDIRNMVSQFDKLQNCTVIEGSLKILLIDYANPSEYSQLSFPDLVEVTEYMLLYRVYGLRTLSQIFPNLAVIRGQTLFFNYALVAWEMPDIEELGLHGLTSIVRGAVRIEKNPKLCYIDTIDWSQITSPQVKVEDNVIEENKDIDECVNVCPVRNGHQCPAIEQTLPNGDIRRQNLCWTGEHCQKVCPSQQCGSRSCYTEHNDLDQVVYHCCHSNCHGGCHGPRDTDCIACSKIFYNGRCVQRCPPGTYEYKERRCITETECRKLHVGKYTPPWKVLTEPRGLCKEECPSGFIQHRNDQHKCEQCIGPCPKECQGLSVDSVSAAQLIKGCTIIKGILEIQIRGGKHIGKELEMSLGQIEEVENYISIINANALTNLRFLKNLRLIRGKKLLRDRYALVVYDNQNLKDIWDFSTHPNLTIEHGSVFFHYNRKLCLHLINTLLSNSGMNGTSDDDVSKDTNGDLIPCDTEELELQVINHQSVYAIIRWKNFFLNDHRELLGWVINLREAEFQNVTMYDSRDACGTDDWKQEDVKPDPDPEAGWIAHILYHLKPFTQYAVYVQTFTVASAKKGAMSPIVYFTTDPDVPWPARDIEVRAESPHSLYVSWKPPSKPNGNVTHYHVYWQPQILDRKKLDIRDYCKDKMRLPAHKKETVIDGNEENNQTFSGECCACPKSKEQVIQEEGERQFQIRFENYLHDSVYVKRPVPNSVEMRSGRRRRQLPASDGNKLDDSTVVGHFGLNNSYNALLKNHTLGINFTSPVDTQTEPEPEPYAKVIVYGATEVVIPDLIHFQEYSIEVIACHDLIENQTFRRCSNRAITTHRTLPDLLADDIDHRLVNVTNGSYIGEVKLRWHDPELPNGLIVTYEIEISRPDTPQLKLETFCVTHKQYWDKGEFRVPDKTAGNYSFRIRATSLAGNGSWTPLMYFYVPARESSPPETNIQMVAGVAAFAALLVIIIVAASIWVVAKKRFNQSIPDGVLYASVNPEYWSAAEVYVPDEWEVPRDKIQLIRELGQGSFGMVWEGIAKDIVPDEPVSKVAVKTVNENATMRDRVEFLNEASVMKVFNCNHVVKLRGVVSKGQPSLVIMELMAKGDLKSYLRSGRQDADAEIPTTAKPPSLKEILQMAGEIADGMAYLAAKKFVHRDLAARNCMVSGEMIVKIGDFGMTREIYETDYYRKGGKGLLPVRWMAPESLQDGLFTSQSDVWSYGVVLWEMATLAAQPYQGLANEQVLHWVIDGGVMEKPEGCPDKLYEIMQLCWNHSPRKRPTFCEIIELLVPDLDPSFKEMAYFFSEEKHAADVSLAEVIDTEEEEGFGDDSRTPLTGSPLHQFPNFLGSNTHVDMSHAIGEDEEELHETLSRQSSLSYESRASDAGSVTGSFKGPCDHQQPCVCVEVTVDNPTSQIPRYPPPNIKTSITPNAENWSPNHVPWDQRNSHSPPYSSEGSKDSSKSSKSMDSSHSGINGFVNGKLPSNHYIPPSKC